LIFFTDSALVFSFTVVLADRYLWQFLLFSLAVFLAAVAFSLVVAALSFTVRFIFDFFFAVAAFL
jgi:hypothetical protein